MVPLVGPGYKPTERDEMGLWKEMDRAEEEIAGSNLLIEDPKLTGYLRDLIGTVGGPAAKDFRIYLARIPDFNAMSRQPVSTPPPDALYSKGIRGGGLLE